MTKTKTSRMAELFRLLRAEIDNGHTCEAGELADECSRFAVDLLAFCRHTEALVPAGCRASWAKRMRITLDWDSGKT